MKNLKFLPLALVTIILFASCDKDEAEVVNEEELITTVTTTLKYGKSTITLKSKDSDGNGPNAPVNTVSGDLMANTTYTGTTTFLNELANPVEDITAEVNAESDEHQLFYQAPASIGVFTYIDEDKNKLPIGLSFELKTGTAAANGNLTITLRHQPSKNASGVSSGDILNAGGATDIAVTFAVKVVAPMIVAAKQ